MPAKIDLSKNKNIEKKILAKVPVEIIAKDEQVSVAHVHNVKKAMKERGIKVPELKKGRPWAPKEPGEPNITAQAIYSTDKNIKENLRNRKKGATMEFKSFPRMPVHLVFTSQDVTVYYGDTSKTITF